MATETTRKPPLRWRKKKSSGMRFSAEAHVLARGDEVFATVQQIGGGWFWYGGRVNTARSPKPLDECKAEAAAHVKSMEGAESV